MNAFCIVAAATVLAGCTASNPVRPIYLPDGEAGYYITCDAISGGECARLASETCGAKGYHVWVTGDLQGESIVCRPTTPAEAEAARRFLEHFPPQQ